VRWSGGDALVITRCDDGTTFEMASMTGALALRGGCGLRVATRGAAHRCNVMVGPIWRNPF
jgi:hypothetical protein